MQIKKIGFVIIFFLVAILSSTSEAGEYAVLVSYNNFNDSLPPMNYLAELENANIQPEPEDYEYYRPKKKASHHYSYSSRLPAQIDSPNENVIIINPHKHVWGAYTADGKLVRSGLATAGGSWCRDIRRPCHTRTGVFRILSLGGPECVSKKYPVHKGGAPMPFCMYFNNSQAIHGSHELADANISHGCVRVSVSDARWIRFNFAEQGMKVIIKPY